MSFGPLPPGIPKNSEEAHELYRLGIEMKVANKYRQQEILKLLPLYENLFRQRHAAELSKGLMSEDDIKKLAIKFAIKNVKSRGGKTKRRRGKKHRRTLKRK